MKVLFCKISSMKYYKGVCNADQAFNGGSFVSENGYGHEELNFLPILFDDDNEVCCGFVEPKSNKGTRNTLHIEKIEGCESLKNAESVEDVLVIWCATREKGDTTVVGWYKHAQVWRDLQTWFLELNNGEDEERCYNVLAGAANCTLLPQGERNVHKWSVPSARYNGSYGFGQSMVWYPTQPAAKEYLNRLIANIESYSGENWLNSYPEEK